MRVLRLEVECEPGREPPPVLVEFRPGAAGESAVRLTVRDGAVVVVGGGSARSLGTDWCEVAGVRLRLGPAGAEAIESNRLFAGFEIRGTAVEEERARVIQCALPGDEGSQIIVGRRRADCDLVVNDRHVSARHLRLFVRDGRLMIEDLQSRWGTNVQGVRLIGARPLRDNDVVTFGNSSFRFINHLERIMRIPRPSPQAPPAAAPPPAPDLPEMSEPGPPPPPPRSPPPSAPDHSGPAPSPRAPRRARRARRLLGERLVLAAFSLAVLALAAAVVAMVTPLGDWLLRIAGDVLKPGGGLP